MRINKDGLDLIREFEGFRSQAYRCPAGVWTIGYGHTSAAGIPEVKRGMEISKYDGEVILKRDLQDFCSAVAKAVTVPLNDNQFSALVSFCYNVGVGAFRRSTLLKRVNAGNFEDVPRQLARWNKSKGKVLKGLQRRRAAEADLFLKGVVLETVPTGTVEIDRGKPLLKSTTNWAAAGGVATVLASVSEEAKTVVGNLSEIFGLSPGWVFIGAGLLFGLWIMRERAKKSSDYGL